MNPKQSLRLFVFLLTFATALATDLLPRQYIQIRNPRPIIGQYHRKGVTNCANFVLSTDRKTLYVGARDTVVALDTARAKINNQKGMVRWAPKREIKDICNSKPNRRPPPAAMAATASSSSTDTPPGSCHSSLLLQRSPQQHEQEERLSCHVLNWSSANLML
ncbi:semaphorin-4A-like [Lacerta agilis]|uniref:semaphorin-4A-like n=1 Tax=Lacerta agilis TaxID=80427 RepID=UPI0014199D75|nr:semaphorin-4A-like [Lacerta agilis]